MEYKVPEDILSNIPQHFWPAFAGELIGVFGLVVFEKDDECGYGLYFLGGTNGWNAALRMTCKKLEMKWLFDYYDKLEYLYNSVFP